MSKYLKSKTGLYLALLFVVCVISVGALANSILPLAVALTDTRIYVKTSSGSGIAYARVDCYLHGFFGEIPTNPSYTIYTDLTGLAQRTMAQGIYTVNVKASGYLDKTVEIDNRVSGEVNPVRTFTIDLVSGGSTQTGYDVDFYLVGSDNRRVSAYVTCNGETLTSDEHGFARFNLESGVYQVRFEGYYLKGEGISLPIQVNFDFISSISVSHATCYTVYLETESVVNQLPPAESNNYDLTGIVSFLMGSIIPGIPNWILTMVGIFLFSRR